MTVRRGFGIVAAIVLAAFLFSALGLVTMYVIFFREPPVPSRATLVLRLSGDLLVGSGDEGLGQLLPGARRHTLRSVVEAIGRAKTDSRITGLLLIPTGGQSPYWATVQELREAITDFRRSGKPTRAFLEYGGDREYYLATACERVVLLPSSPLQLTGLASYELFLRGTLDMIDAYPDLYHIGDYKTASNAYTERTFTAAHREMAESLNRDAFEQLVAGIADGRRRSAREVEALMDAGPFLPEEAVRVGLVDDLAYEDQVADELEASDGGRRVTLEQYVRATPWSGRILRAPRIALVHASGAIVSGDSGFDPVNGDVVGSDTLLRALRDIQKDDSIRAVILRIDSPGGSAVASDVIWRELRVTREAGGGRPLVASMSDLAASGGYYIAMAAPTIVAEPGTLTGSIGIFGGKIVTGGTFAKLGAHIEGVSEGRFADMNSPVRPYSDDERAKVEAQLQAFYDQFVEKVAEARKMTPERVDQVARGRVWTGRQAKEIGLVDALGGLDRAIALAKQAAKIRADSAVSLVVYPARRTLFDLLTGGLATGADAGSLRLLRAAGGDGLAQAAAPLLFRRGEPLALMPFAWVR